MTSRNLLLSAAALAVAVALTGCGDPLGDKQVTIELRYQGDSNYGPEDATGTAFVDTTTGQVDIEVQGLPMLTDELYEGWLAGGGESPLSTGKFNTDDQGEGSSTIEVGDITDKAYERVVLTVEPDPDPTPKPDSRHSIQGDLP